MEIRRIHLFYSFHVRMQLLLCGCLRSFYVVLSLFVGWFCTCLMLSHEAYFKRFTVELGAFYVFYTSCFSRVKGTVKLLDYTIAMVLFFLKITTCNSIYVAIKLMHLQNDKRYSCCEVKSRMQIFRNIRKVPVACIIKKVEILKMSKSRETLRISSCALTALSFKGIRP